MKKEIINQLIESIKDDLKKEKSDPEQQLDIEMLEKISLSKSSEVEIGSLVDLKLNGKVQKYFLSPSSGGSLVQVKGRAILVISAFSPLGSMLIGKKGGEQFSMETKNGQREYTIDGIS